VLALLLVVASGLSYPGGTIHDASTRGYSFTHNFLSDLGTTVAFDGQRNTKGARLFGVNVVIGGLVLGRLIVATVRLLSAAPRPARSPVSRCRYWSRSGRTAGNSFATSPVLCALTK
jgi:hypothetical protein